MNVSAILETRNLDIALSAGSDRAYAVKNSSLHLNSNEVLCIVGESGSGKSMLARAVMGLLPGPSVYVSGGQVIFEGTNILNVSQDHLRMLRGNKISMIFQEPMSALNPLMMIGDQIEEVLLTHTELCKSERRKRVSHILSEVHLPNSTKIYQSYPHQLSGGQCQRVMIAMALILRPQIIIADEPTTALDATTQALILKLIQELQTTHGTGIIFITHDFGVVAEIADRVVVMKHGEIVETGTCTDILNNPSHAYTQQLINAVPKLGNHHPDTTGNSSLALKTCGLRKTFHSGSVFSGGKRKVVAIRDVSVNLFRGETLGVVGESGSGKSTLARLIVRLLDPDEGSVIIDGINMIGRTGHELKALRKQVQMIFQDPHASLNPRHKISRILTEGAILHGMSRDVAIKQAHELLQLVGMSDTVMARFPHEFSGGQRQRIGIARALALKPSILIADEPVSALDVSVQAQVLNLLSDIKRNLGLSMLFITHDLCVAAEVCDRIAVMRNGEIVEQGKTENILNHPKHDYTKSLFASLPGKDWLLSLTPTR